MNARATALLDLASYLTLAAQDLAGSIRLTPEIQLRKLDAVAARIHVARAEVAATTAGRKDGR